jgi:hypothetical protein
MLEPGFVIIFEGVNLERCESFLMSKASLVDQEYIERVDEFLSELIWMGRVLRYNHEDVAPVWMLS